ncbi:predicted protein [Postia placenta Mad-698-R]|uniref:Uncharacterized protein n=1 Tax=Postia placenta MAD-698-R-SB12 TaxID=670580 RepID=A0A1X6MZH1_9APHY|nr:hypothetical protein POSPLADRAFT_1034212 [Postia placenta MAD-698-R-SB12]EED82608.1 predicted protein [Postia placenta Mad-698-R]OSX61650.1 hypothetical protein POSPLADRAFT_1034212 [Postia placenta MAD-698-R-SB12]
MLFTSVIDPAVKSSQQLIIVRYGMTRILVPLSESYEEMQAVAARELGLNGRPDLFTDQIHGSTGEKIKIHKDAWAGISPLLGSISIETVNANARRSSAGRQSLLPSRVVVHEAGAVLPAEVMSTNRRVSRLSFAAAPSGSASAKAALPRSGVFKPASVNASLSHAPAEEDANASYVTNIDDEEEEEELEEELMLSSPKKSRRPRVYSDDEEEYDEVKEKPEEERDEVKEEPEETQKHGLVIERSPSVEFADSYVSEPLAARDERKVSPVHEPEPKASRERQPPPPSPKSFASHRSMTLSAEKRPDVFSKQERPQKEPTNSASGSVKAKDLAEVRPEKISAPKERLSQGRAPPTVVQSQSRATESFQPRGDEVGPNDRFVVIVEYDDGAGTDENQMMFKTRGRHTVSRVLLQACKTFGIEDLFPMARLVLIVDVEDGDEIVEHRFHCALEDTMARAGAKPEARFAIEIDEE